MIDPLGVDGYRDFEVIGTGGFSTVYRAFQDRFHRTVAVKVLATTFASEDAQRRFLRECRIAGSSSGHPNIVTILDAGITASGQPYLVFEYMSGGSLAKRLVDGGPFAIADVLRIGVKISGALASMHASGILHRDLKPQNVLLSEFGEPCVTDFGISAMSSGSGATSMTQSLTPLFTAPEVLDGEASTAGSDIYSLGATMYALLVGRAPFQPTGPESVRATLGRILDETAPDVAREGVPGSLEGLLAACLAKQPWLRPASMVLVGQGLQQIQAEMGLAISELPVVGVDVSGMAVDPGAGELSDNDGATVVRSALAMPASADEEVAAIDGSGPSRNPLVAPSAGGAAVPDMTVVRPVHDVALGGQLPGDQAGGWSPAPVPGGPNRLASTGEAKTASVEGGATQPGAGRSGGGDSTITGEGTLPGGTPIDGGRKRRRMPRRRVVTAAVAVGVLAVGALVMALVFFSSPGFGTTWSKAPIPPGSYNLYGVACPSTADCVAVGANADGTAPVILTTTNGGTTWSKAPIPPGSYGLNGVACPSTADCVAVGANADGTAPVILTTTNGGTTWSKAPIPPGSYGLNGVACPSTADCVAVGANADGTAPVILTTTNGGTTWSKAPIPPGSYSLNGVACPSTADCVAVGWDIWSSPPVILTTTNGGTTWSKAPIPPGSYTLYGVACPSTADCVAVGANPSITAPVILTTTNGGTTWSKAPTPPGSYNLYVVACPSTADCVAVGANPSITAPVILTTTNGGTTWSKAPIPPGSYGLGRVACPSTGDCVAVGENTRITAPVILTTTKTG